MSKLKVTPCNLNIVKVYAHSSESTDEEMDNFQNQLENTVKEISRKPITIEHDNINRNGMLWDWNRNLAITNTMFK